MSLLHLRVVSPADLRDEVEALLRGQRGTTNLVVLPGAAREPGGDLIQADLARECVQDVLSGLRELGVDRRGSISLHAVDMAIGDGVRRAERTAPGDAADAVIWEEVSTEYIYQPGWFSLLTALVAGAAGMLSLTSARSAVLVGVFISVTTIPAAGNLALALVFGRFHDAAGSALQLVINLTGIVAAGYLVLLARGHSRVSDDRPSRYDTAS